jgi:hypothetical protein
MNYFISILTSIWLIININTLKLVQQGDVVDYYHIPSVLNFNDLNYTLSWSSHPSANYYKQEYLNKGEVLEHFDNLITIEFFITDIEVKNVVQSQISSLIERKKYDRICNYNVIKNRQTGEYILDFILSENESNHSDIVEWNAYHYKPYTDKKGNKGVILFALSHRAYDNAINVFSKEIKGYRIIYINKLLSYKIPEIYINRN